MQTDSMERIIPDDLPKSETTGAGTLKLHLERYAFASSQLAAGRVLDIACGVGYGTFLLAGSSACRHVTGVDVDAGAIAYARSRYSNPKVGFEVGSASTYMTDSLFDTIVTLETIEHLTDPVLFVAHLATLVKPGGRIIASTPTTPSVDANPYHLHDFNPKSFRRLFLAFGFSELSSFEQTQWFSPIDTLLHREQRTSSIRRGLPRYYLQHPRSLGRRILSTVRYGFSNRYTTIAWEAPGR